MPTSDPGFRTGIGYDVHRVAPGRQLVLGGVNIPYNVGLEGHSDADVLTHAIMDALLGAAGLGDIGQLFPPTDPAYKDANSIELLKEVRGRVHGAGFCVVNVDATVIAEAPRVAPHTGKMRDTLALAMHVRPTAVNIKATTNESMGFIGRREGIAVLATAMLARLGWG